MSALWVVIGLLVVVAACLCCVVDVLHRECRELGRVVLDHSRRIRGLESGALKQREVR